VAGDERVVGLHLGKTRGTEQLSQSAITAPIIENALGPGDRKQAAQKCSIRPGTCLWIVRINQQVFLVVDVTLKILLGEMVESRCEDELAYRASVVIDRYTGDSENATPVNLAALVEIDDTVEVSHGTTAF